MSTITALVLGRPLQNVTTKLQKLLVRGDAVGLCRPTSAQCTFIRQLGCGPPMPTQPNASPPGEGKVTKEY